MTWMRPPTQAFSPFTKLEYQRPNKFHIIGDWLSKNRWVALCDMKARQYGDFPAGEEAKDPEDKCGRCSVLVRKK